MSLTDKVDTTATDTDVERLEAETLCDVTAHIYHIHAGEVKLEILHRDARSFSSPFTLNSVSGFIVNYFEKKCNYFSMVVFLML